MKSITLNIHSMADIITNSSTEIFVVANESTIQGVKDLIDNFLLLTDSSLTCDDLFTVEYNLDDMLEDIDYDYRCYIKSEDDDPPMTLEEFTAKKREEFSGHLEINYDGYGPSRYLQVTAKTDSEHAVTCAKILSNLTGLFEIDAYYS